MSNIDNLAAVNNTVEDLGFDDNFLEYKMMDTPTIKIKLSQFPTNHKTCAWLQTLINEAKSYFKGVAIIDDCLMIRQESNWSHKLDVISEISSVDFSYTITD